MNIRMPNRRWVNPIIIVVVAALAGVFLWNKRVHQPAPPERLTFAIPKGSLSIPLWVAQAKGFYGAEGLAVTVRPFDFGKPAFDAMLTGEADVAATGTTPIVLASFSRRDFVVIANTSYSENNSKIVALRERGIREVSDLKGKTIGVSKGTTSEFFLEHFLARHALPSASVNTRDLPPGEMVQHLDAGDVDAVSAFQPYVLMARLRLGDRAVIFGAPGSYPETFYLATRREYARTHAPALKRLLRAIERADEFISTHPAEVQNIMGQVWGIAPSDVAPLLADLRSDISLQQSMLGLMEDAARWAIQQRVVEPQAVPDYIEFIDSEALRAVKPGAVTLIE